MTDFNPLAEKINHIDKMVIKIQTTLENRDKVFDDMAKDNAFKLANHNERISKTEKEIDTYKGGINALNRLLTLIGSFIVLGAIWIFSQIHAQKNSLDLLRTDLLYQKEQINQLEKQVEKINEKYNQSINK